MRQTHSQPQGLGSREGQAAAHALPCAGMPGENTEVGHVLQWAMAAMGS